MKTDVKIPYHLSLQDRDKRGLPIPWIVFRDKEGTPHFTVNDSAAVQMALAQKLCGLCGKPHKLGSMWLIGGPTAAFHETGLFIDPPVHEECGRYAMLVCPFIAAPNYSKRIDLKTINPEKMQDATIVADNGMNPDRPALFIFARTSGFKLIDAGDGMMPYVQPRRPWKQIEYWLKGEQITQDQAHAIQDKEEYPPRTLIWWPK